MTHERTSPPLVWILAGRRTGDNLQLEVLADALGWPREVKRLSYRRSHFTWTPYYGRLGPSTVPLTREALEGLVPPWPDLVLSVGWRSAPVARWVARQGGGRSVAIGRPRAPISGFDLVLSPPQYRVPEAENLVKLRAPLTRTTPERLAQAAEEWHDRLAHLPRPLIGALIGGNAFPYRLTEAAAVRLGDQLDALARARGGSVLVAGGPRTPARSARALLARLTVPKHHFLWGDPGENPYFGYLALADELVVTTESVSMATEASLTGKPVHLFDLPMLTGPLARGIYRFDHWLRRGGGPVGRAYLGLIRNGWLVMPRVTEDFHEGLIAEGRAQRLGALTEIEPPEGPPEDQTARAAAAVRALFESR
ncbi:MAG: mitochondrial fission ELM1 family protein [Paracoccaceae bacterium]|nr:mitochondrial fission ELM1 family protein [Paracoccaceae bacterium]